ncbi:MFS transporter, CP family, cyanate transporter [Rhodococcoides kyotonense]|uniref:MFS transporter, CP family, cyanate transporter n=1 Tax=Rhodococcoides kyotonense TaxID=398843 RepID=A0A239LUQ5_9NOCA|nr:MFS transporter, CP family, cyanate transporter [Rhodococcus kyotonensis]
MILAVGTSAVTETSDRIDSSVLVRGRILVFAAVIVSALTLRAAVTSISPLFGRIGEDLHFGSGVVGIVGMLPPAMFAVFGLLTPVIAKRTGLERAALIAMTLTTVGMAARAFAPGTASLLVLSAVALAGMGIGNVVIPPLVKRYFSDRLAIVSTMYICALQVSTLVPPLLAVPVADAHGWRLSIGVWAVVGLAAALPWLGVVWARRGHDVNDVSEEQGSAAVHEHSAGRIWRSSLAWGMVGMFAMTSFITYAMLTWLPTLLTDAGIGEAPAGASVAAFGAMGLVTSLGAPSLCARLRNPYGLVVAAAVFYLVGFAGLHFSPTVGTVVWVCLIGLGTLTFPMSLTLMNLRTRTPAGSSGLSGFTQGLGYVVSSMGPLSFGLLHTLSGGWGVPILALTGCVAVLLVAGFYCCRPRMLEDTW